MISCVYTIGGAWQGRLMAAVVLCKWIEANLATLEFLALSQCVYLV